MKLYMESQKPDLIINFNANCLKYPEEYEIFRKLYEIKPMIFVKKSKVHLKDNIRTGRIIETCNKLLARTLRSDMVMNVSSMGQAIEMLRQNKLEAVCGLDTVVNYYVEKNNKFHEKLVVYKKMDESEPGFEAVICSKKSIPSEIKKKLELASPKIIIPVFKQQQALVDHKG